MLKITELVDSKLFVDLPDSETVNISGGVLAPTCVDASPGRKFGFPTVTVTNGCSTTQRVKAVFAFGRDSGCEQLGARGDDFTFLSGIAARFDRLELC